MLAPASRPVELVESKLFCSSYLKPLILLQSLARYKSLGLAQVPIGGGGGGVSWVEIQKVPTIVVFPSTCTKYVRPITRPVRSISEPVLVQPISVNTPPQAPVEEE